MIARNDKAGKWADMLTADEVSFSKQAGEVMRKVDWAKPLLCEDKVALALQCGSKSKLTPQKLFHIKAALFEVRFAYALHVAGVSAEYEHLTGLGDSSVDFYVPAKDGKSGWLIELTGLRDSEAVKEATREDEAFFGYASISKPGVNSEEVRDIIKSQRAILSKVCDKQGNSIKFPVPQNGIYHIVVIDIRGFNGGVSDCYDYCNIVYGSAGLKDVNRRNWIDDKGRKEYIKGIFDPAHPDPKSKQFQQRIHAIAFLVEKEYFKGEINSKIKLFPNQNLFNESEMQNFCKQFPLQSIAKNY